MAATANCESGLLDTIWPGLHRLPPVGGVTSLECDGKCRSGVGLFAAEAQLERCEWLVQFCGFRLVCCRTSSGRTGSANMGA